jgi:hypothetical protein
VAAEAAKATRLGLLALVRALMEVVDRKLFDSAPEFFVAWAGRASGLMADVVALTPMSPMDAEAAPDASPNGTGGVPQQPRGYHARVAAVTSAVTGLAQELAQHIATMPPQTSAEGRVGGRGRGARGPKA